MTYLNRIFAEKAKKKYGDIFTEAEIEEARCIAYRTVSDFIRDTGARLPNDTLDNLFFKYLEYMKGEKEA